MKFKRSSFIPNFDRSILENISWSWDNVKTHHDVATIVKDKKPYTITVLMEFLKYEYRNKKEYVKKTKIPIGGKYKELLYEYFEKEFGRGNGNTVYSQWLETYRPIHDKEKKHEMVDDYIVKHELEPRYKEKILKRFTNHEQLFKERIKIKRDRYYNLPEPLSYIDWRNPYDTIFVWEEGDKKVARRGGSGASGSREVNSKFIYGLLELNKTQPVPSYLFLYSEENTLLFIKKFNNLCVPLMDIGENYHLDHAEAKQLMQQGTFIRWDVLRHIQEVNVGSYTQLLAQFSRRSK